MNSFSWTVFGAVSMPSARARAIGGIDSMQSQTAENFRRQLIANIAHKLAFCVRAVSMGSSCGRAQSDPTVSRSTP